jgi:hypothetical protein
VEARAFWTTQLHRVPFNRRRASFRSHTAEDFLGLKSLEDCRSYLQSVGVSNQKPSSLDAIFQGSTTAEEIVAQSSYSSRSIAGFTSMIRISACIRQSIYFANWIIQAFRDAKYETEARTLEREALEDSY